MTLTEAMRYRGLTVWKLAERTGVKTQTAKKWTEPGGTRKITVERLRQITEIRDMVRRAMVQPALREQERQQTEKHRKETTA